MLRNDEPKSALPPRWLDGTVPLAIGVAAAVGTCATAACSRGARPEWLSTLALIAVVACFIAGDNARDGKPEHRRFVFSVAVLAALAAIIALATSAAH